MISQRCLQEQEHLHGAGTSARSPSSAWIHLGDARNSLCSAHRELLELQRGWTLSRSHQPQLWSSSPCLEPSEPPQAIPRALVGHSWSLKGAPSTCTASKRCHPSPPPATPSGPPERDIPVENQSGAAQTHWEAGRRGEQLCPQGPGRQRGGEEQLGPH